MRTRALIASAILSLVAAASLAACSQEEDHGCLCPDNSDETCTLSKACAESVRADVTGCDALALTIYTETAVNSGIEHAVFLRPNRSLNPTCTTWIHDEPSTELPLDDNAPYLVREGSHFRRCDFQNTAVPVHLLSTRPYGGIYTPFNYGSDPGKGWSKFLADHCPSPSPELRTYMGAGEPCYTACVNGTQCAGADFSGESLCEACTTSPCEGVYSYAFCKNGAILMEDNIAHTIFDRLGVEVPQEAGVRQLLAEVMPCCAPFEYTLNGTDASVHFLRGQGVILRYYEGYFEAPDRCITWATLRDQDSAEETLYRCDFSDSADLWQSLTLDESGDVTNFDALKEEWLTHCEAFTPEVPGAVNTWDACLTATGEGYACAPEEICTIDTLFRPRNVVGRIGYCEPPFVPEAP